MTLENSGYLQALRQLPRPTQGQTERFARFVADAHSWYKHLPITPKVPFEFFLDPGAGMSIIHTLTGETALLPITDESTRFHYTWQKTEDYRRRFGHWNYYARYGPAVYLLEKGGLADTHGKTHAVLTDAGDWMKEPDNLTALGTAQVSALIHSMPNFGIWASQPEHFGLNKCAAEEFFSHMLNVLSGFPPSPSVNDLVASVPNLLQSAMTHTQGGRSAGRKVIGNWDWPDDDWLEQRRAEGISAEHISLLVKYLDLHYKRLNMAEFTRILGKKYGQSDAEALATRMAEERGRELLAMTTAMNQYAEAVYQ